MRVVQIYNFRHHENEIAQSEAHNHAPFANYWMHNGFINIDNEKMSKSLGNFILVHDIIKEVDPDVLRFFMIGSISGNVVAAWAWMQAD